jgi:hypothetical protein
MPKLGDVAPRCAEQTGPSIEADGRPGMLLSGETWRDSRPSSHRMIDVFQRTRSSRALARHLVVSETAVRRAEKAGRIGRETDGAWDLARVRAAWAGNTDPAQQRGEPGARDGSRNGARRTVKPVPEAALGAVRDTLREHGGPIGAGAMTFMQARTANEVLEAQERRLRLQRIEGELVDRAKAVAQVFRLARTSAMPGSTGRRGWRR